MKQIPDFGELIIRYRKPVKGHDPVANISKHALSWRWEEEGIGHELYITDTELGLDVAAEYVKMLFEDAMYRISELQEETDET